MTQRFSALHCPLHRPGWRARSARSRPSWRASDGCEIDWDLHLSRMSPLRMETMTQANSPKQLRLIIETDDFDDAVRFYRDVLGMPEQPAFATEGDDRVSILHAGIATIELATATHVRN